MVKNTWQKNFKLLKESFILLEIIIDGITALRLKKNYL